MLIIGVDYHPSDQYIAFVDRETGEYGERRLNHSDREAEKFYRELAARGVSVRVGTEATGYSRWFERLLAELGVEVWIGDAAKIKTKRVRKQKTDYQVGVACFGFVNRCLNASGLQHEFQETEALRGVSRRIIGRYAD
ncbi:MAG: hypothetical protein WAN72_14930 [Candidatus Acidiferrales bacterium]